MKSSRIIPEIKILYQHPPRRRNTFHHVPWKRNWTYCMETYQHAAKREYELLLANYRQANHLVTVKYFRKFTNLQIILLWSKLKTLLQQQGIIAYVVVEITTRRHIFPDGGYRDYPIKKIHYHFLIDSDLSEPQLRVIFNRACLDAGLVHEAFEVHYEVIPDRKTFKHKIEYVLKFGKFAEQAILFKPKTGIDKIDTIEADYVTGAWFIKADGTRANKDKMWKELVGDWYSDKPDTKHQQPISITIRLSVSIQIRNQSLTK